MSRLFLMQFTLQVSVMTRWSFIPLSSSARELGKWTVIAWSRQYFLSLLEILSRNFRPGRYYGSVSIVLINTDHQLKTQLILTKTILKSTAQLWQDRSRLHGRLSTKKTRKYSNRLPLKTRCNYWGIIADNVRQLNNVINPGLKKPSFRPDPCEKWNGEVEWTAEGMKPEWTARLCYKLFMKMALFMTLNRNYLQKNYQRDWRTVFCF